MAGDTPIRVRRDVQSLIDGDEEDRAVLDDYARAIRIMRDLDAGEGGLPPSNPLSWRFQAAIHGIDAEGDPTWNSCEHFSWLFLPWHRMYLYRFEAIIQHHLGDDTWALPYWDYTKRLPDGSADREACKLPSAFREPRDDNELFTDRRVRAINDGAPIDGQFTDARGALRTFPFALEAEDARATFGGSKFAHLGDPRLTRGALEGTPHGNVHVAVGGKDLDPDASGNQSGWMYRFETAGLDPIFWLHHCNLDRLWEVWRNVEDGHDHSNPSDDVWLRSRFEFFDVHGTRQPTFVRDVLETEALGYRYESIDPPGAPPVAPFAVSFAREEPGSSPELVGATMDVPFAEPTAVRVELDAPRRVSLDRIDEPEEERWHLRVEDVRGVPDAAVAYAVDLDVEPPGGADVAPIRVGLVSAFGIIEASQPDERHGAAGVSDVFDITDAVRDLEAQGVWDASHAVVTIVPLGLEGQPVPGGSVAARRISIYRG